MVIFVCTNQKHDDYNSCDDCHGCTSVMGATVRLSEIICRQSVTWPIICRQMRICWYARKDASVFHKNPTIVLNSYSDPSEGLLYLLFLSSRRQSSKPTCITITSPVAVLANNMSPKGISWYARIDASVFSQEPNRCSKRIFRSLRGLWCLLFLSIRGHSSEPTCIINMSPVAFVAYNMSPFDGTLLVQHDNRGDQSEAGMQSAWQYPVFRGS